MASPELMQVADRIARTGKVTADDAAAVRRAIYGGDGQVTDVEADALIAIEQTRETFCAEWSSLYVEALTDYVLMQQPPSGYLSEANAEWLQSRIKRRKEPSPDCDVALVANIIENASEVPASFSAFALRLVKETVLYSDGVDARGHAHGAGQVTDADVEMLKRILWGAGSEGLLAVSREEAEALFAIADQTTGADNSPAFEDLFARAIGNYLIGATGRSATPRDLALRWQTEPEYKISVLATLGKVLSSTGKGFNKDFVTDTIANARTLAEDVELRSKLQNEAREAASAAASVMTADKAGWLMDRVNKNGLLTAPEIALLRFIQREASSLDESLKGLMAKVA